MQGITLGTAIGDIKGDTGRLNYSSNDAKSRLSLGFSIPRRLGGRLVLSTEIQSSSR